MVEAVPSASYSWSLHMIGCRFTTYLQFIYMSRSLLRILLLPALPSVLLELQRASEVNLTFQRILYQD